jgi:hypothetical protein
MAPSLDGRHIRWIEGKGKSEGSSSGRRLFNWLAGSASHDSGIEQKETEWFLTGFFGGMVMPKVRLFEQPEDRVSGLKRQITAMSEEVVDHEIEKAVNRETDADPERWRPQRVIESSD